MLEANKLQLETEGVTVSGLEFNFSIGSLSSIGLARLENALPTRATTDGVLKYNLRLGPKGSDPVQTCLPRYALTR